MNTYIKYERISKRLKESDINEFLRKIITDGCDLLFYKEDIKENGAENAIIDVVVVVGRKRTIL